ADVTGRGCPRGRGSVARLYRDGDDGERLLPPLPDGGAGARPGARTADVGTPADAVRADRAPVCDTCAVRRLRPRDCRRALPARAVRKAAAARDAGALPGAL